jgi:hypothetical protein
MMSWLHLEGLNHAVHEAECPVHGSGKPLAVEQLRESQALSERLIGILAPAEKSRARLVVAA